MALWPMVIACCAVAGAQASPPGSAVIDSLFRTTRALAARTGGAASAPKAVHAGPDSKYLMDCGAPASFTGIRAAGTRRLGGRLLSARKAEDGPTPPAPKAEDGPTPPVPKDLPTSKPGPGMDPEDITPYATVLKDGFWFVDCVKDRLLIHGDKFGNNKFSYNMVSSDVSIVRYLDHVPKEKRSLMTHAVCFKFCRSVPLMSFFGLAHGRDCYCAPFYDMMAGDSSECTAVCEGDTSTMCGGMAKSSIFEMHSCPSVGPQEIHEEAPTPGPMTVTEDTTTTTTTSSAAPTEYPPKVDEWADADEPDFDGALVALSKTCGTRGQKLASPSTGALTAADCAALAEGAGATAFSLGKNYAKGTCYAETLDVTPDLVESWKANKANPECPVQGGWTPDKNFDFYYIIEVDQYDGNNYSR